MNYKVIALLVVCIAVVAATGCMGLSSGTSTSSQDSATYDNGVRYPSEAKMSYGSNGAPMPVPTMAPSLAGSGLSLIHI